jgi:hypothetical protein
MTGRRPGVAKGEETGLRVSGPAAGSRASGSGTGARASSRGAGLAFHPLTPDRWADLETLFGPRGACCCCWCMAWRLAPPEFGHRKQGVTVALLRAAAIHARKAGARILEGYPVEPRQGELPAVFAWTGLASAFREAGFVEVARRSATRPIFRLTLRKGASPRAARRS